MRISDWSSDVCSSDLVAERRRLWRPHLAQPRPPARRGARTLARPRPERSVRLHRPSGAIYYRFAVAAGDDRAAGDQDRRPVPGAARSEEHTSELQSLMSNSDAVFCLKRQKNIIRTLK